MNNEPQSGKGQQHSSHVQLQGATEITKDLGKLAPCEQLEFAEIGHLCLNSSGHPQVRQDRPRYQYEPLHSEYGSVCQQQLKTLNDRSVIW